MTWVEAHIGDFVDIKHGFPFESEFFGDEGEYVVLTPGHCQENGGFRSRPGREKHYNATPPDGYVLAKGDILVVMTDLVSTAPVLGGSLRIPEHNRYLHNQRLGLVKLTRPDLLDEHFLFHVFNTHHYRAQVRGSASGATVRHTSPSRIRACRVRYPKLLSEQVRIAEILSAYDELIENNRKRIALLEEAARLLYREWFVHLRFPGHEHVKVVDGKPEGWERKPLGEVADCRLGKMLDQNKNKGELMPYLANVNVRWGSIDLGNLREMRFEDDEREAFGVRYGDIVMCEGGEPGRCALWKEQLPRMMFQKAIHRVRAHAGIGTQFLYYCLRHQAQSGQLARLFTGATIKHLPREKLVVAQVLIPPVPLMMVFEEHVEPIERQMSVLEAANRRATEARDLLLPRLMSGEIAV